MSEQDLVRAPSPSGLAGAKMIARGLTTTQRKFLASGVIHGDFTMATVRTLKRKGLFELVIDSPNGRCGFMRLTPLGEAVRDILSPIEWADAPLKAAHGTARHPNQSPSPVSPDSSPADQTPAPAASAAGAGEEQSS